MSPSSSRQSVRDHLDLVVQTRTDLLNAADDEASDEAGEQSIFDGATAARIAQEPPQDAHAGERTSQLVEESLNARLGKSKKGRPTSLRRSDRATLGFRQDKKRSPANGMRHSRSHVAIRQTAEVRP